MFKRQIVRNVKPDAPRRVHEGQNQVRYRLDGNLVWVKEVSPGKALVPTSHYFARLKGADGKVRLQKLTRDKTTSTSLLGELRRHEDLVRAGLALPKADTEEATATLLERYLAEKLGAGITQAWADNIKKHVTAAATRMGWQTLEDIRHGATPPRLAGWAATLEGAGQTKMARIVAVRGFLGWLHQIQLLANPPRVKGFSRKVESKRRIFTQDELARIFKATPWRRALFYRLSLSTLARRGALGKVVAEDFNLDNKAGATMQLRAEHSKTKTAQVVPIQPELVADLRKLISEIPPGAPVFSTAGVSNGTKALRKDLKRAGVPYKTAEGIVCVHCFRHTGASILVKAGVNLLAIQRLGGWSNLRMLSQTYAHLVPTDSTAAIGAAMGGMLSPVSKKRKK